MDADGMWRLVDGSAQHGETRDEREQWLYRRLLPLPRADLLDFVQHLSATREPANTYRLWLAADLIQGGRCTADGFHYFQMWLVGQGRAAYDAAIDDPDSLAALADVRRLAGIAVEDWADADWPEWESLEYVAGEAAQERADIDGDIHDVVTEERGVELRTDPDPADVELRGLDAGAVAKGYPRLWALFGDRWPDRSAL